MALSQSDHLLHSQRYGWVQMSRSAPNMAKASLGGYGQEILRDVVVTTYDHELTQF